MSVEITDKIKYEFFLIFGGLAPLLFVFWLYIFHEEKFHSLSSIPLLLYSASLVIATGIYFFLVGFKEITEDYSRRKDISIRKYRLGRYEIDKKLLKLPAQYIKNVDFPKEDIDI